ncbi:hypothetical protein [Geomicrobium sp. JCM 19055]|uniref:hypothetical protein n=1 Tax=Geomicrobium sp. JCM 19055 TaxID=1460649 RepID=UPI0026B1172A
MGEELRLSSRVGARTGELSHFDVFGDHQKHVLEREGLIEQYERFVNTKPS